MKKLTFSTGALMAALFLAGCATEAGIDRRDNEYGVATRANFAVHDAYNLSNERLRDLGRDFAAKSTDTVTFAFNSSRLDAAARTALDSQVKWLKANKAIKMTIVGHADAVGSRRYNYGLGLRRARAVLRYLNRRGISRKRLAAISSRGELDPVIPTQARERRNRRTVTTVSGIVRRYVGLGIDGEYAAKVYDTYQAVDKGVNQADSTTVN